MSRILQFMRKMSPLLEKCNRRWAIFALLFLAILTGMHALKEDALTRYQNLLSIVVYDRNAIPLHIEENKKGLYAYPLSTLPDEFKMLLIQKEDRFFYYHLGINPFSTIRALTSYITGKHTGGGSTITQQLVKNILLTESERTFMNKGIEALYAVSLELFTSKDEILTMYAHSVFLGNQLQGFESGSRAYFNKPFAETSPEEQITLLATLSHPSTRNPWRAENEAYAQTLYERLRKGSAFIKPIVTASYAFQHTSDFELQSLGVTCTSRCTTTLDVRMNETLRSILASHIAREYARGARNGAIVVINPKNGELLALVGSPDPSHANAGNQINMALEPRPIGSTVKPLIYLKGFMEGLRPYSRIDDREYKYPIATGFPLYPKNFDGIYHGEMSLHEALSNSLNVPTVKVLEFIGLSTFYQFLTETLKFIPIQPLDSYQYGIALGGLEMDLLTLTHYFTVFPRLGTIPPLRVLLSGDQKTRRLPPQSTITETIAVAEPQYVALVQAIISDRLTGVNQFGLKSNLNLTIPSYAVKTGTSRDFHDSWVVGYTNDFVVGVWLGNAENEALEQVSGASGAGAIWHDVMEYLVATPYYSKSTFREEFIRKISIGDSLEWGLPSDIVEDHDRLLLEDRLITTPHEGDTFERTQNTTIPLHARTEVLWSVNGKTSGEFDTVNFKPTKSGNYEISAKDSRTGKTEYIQIKIVDPVL